MKGGEADTRQKIGKPLNGHVSRTSTHTDIFIFKNTQWHGHIQKANLSETHIDTAEVQLTAPLE